MQVVPLAIGSRPKPPNASRWPSSSIWTATSTSAPRRPTPTRTRRPVLAGERLSTRHARAGRAENRSRAGSSSPSFRPLEMNPDTSAGVPKRRLAPDVTKPRGPKSTRCCLTARPGTFASSDRPRPRDQPRDDRGHDRARCRHELGGPKAADRRVRAGASARGRVHRWTADRSVPSPETARAAWSTGRSALTCADCRRARPPATSPGCARHAARHSGGR
jgi:hypothetical protein